MELAVPVLSFDFRLSLTFCKAAGKGRYKMLQLCSRFDIDKDKHVEMPTVAFFNAFLTKKNHPGHIRNVLLRWAVLCFSVKLVSVITRDAAWI